MLVSREGAGYGTQPMKCRRCDGEGELTIRLGKPDPSRNNHAAYTGVWCVYPAVECEVCLGFGNERDKINKQAGKRVQIHDKEHRPAASAVPTVPDEVREASTSWKVW